MSQESFRSRNPRCKSIAKRDPLTQALFDGRRWLSRVSLVDTGALILVWGNILGLLAYPVIASAQGPGKTAQEPVVKVSAEKG